MPRRRRFRAFDLAVSLAALVAPASAATYVPISDVALVDQSPAIILGTVVESAALPADSSTLTRVAITAVLKGGALPSPLVVRVPGFVGGGEALLVPGAPRFAAGERVLLFLSPRADGTWGIVQFLLGAFHQVERDGRRLAVRDLAGAVALGGAAPEAPRDLERFADWIRSRGRGRTRAADYDLAEAAASAPRPAADDFTLLGHARWQDFDSGGSVAWQFHSAGWDGAGAGAAAFAAGRGAWNADANTPVQYASGGTSAAAGPGLAAGDGQNRIIFGDPNDEISGSFSCASGGVVAIGGYNPSGTHVFHGESYGTISEGDIVVQDGIACFFSAHPGADEDVFAHELGHTLGIGHSADSAALMFPSATAPYSASLGADDRAAVCFLYGSSCPGAPPPSPPAAPTNLAAQATSATQVHLTWNDNASNETSFRVEVRTGGAPFVDVGSVGANVTSATVSGLATATAYDFRVRARNGTGDSAYSNTASATTSSGGSTPQAPSGLAASALSSTSIRLQWQDHSNDETGFRIERWVGTFFADIGGVGANITAVDVIGLAPATAYTFRVKARNGAGDSAASNEATATTLGDAIAPPAAPANLQAAAASTTLINLFWSDLSANEDSFRIEARSGGAPFAEIAAAGPNATSISIDGLAPGTGYDFRVKARNTAGDSAFSNIASAETPADCGEGDPDTICLNGGRFAARIAWRTPDGQQGVGHPVRLSADSAYFWFFLPDSIEVVAKVLDGCALSQTYWVFATGLTNVETHLTVTDTVTHEARTYDNLQGQAFQPLQDTAAFRTCASDGPSASAALALPAPRPAPAANAAAACAPGDLALCLQGGRFRVEAFWRTAAGQTGQGHAAALTPDSGDFWFFDPSNIELVVKVLDACSFADRFWVFAGGLTNVEVRLRVTDTQTGAVKEYTNPLNQPYLPLQDASAFATCP